MYHDMLKKFREDRRLTKNAGDLFGNVYKELGEVYDEIKKNNVHGVIEEFADVIIFCENYAATKVVFRSDRKVINQEPELAFQFSLQALFEFKCQNYFNLVESIIDECISAIRFLGYDYEKVVLEKAKVICSRKGAWNEQTQKWEKDPMQDKSTLYAPDYESCKIKG